MAYFPALVHLTVGLLLFLLAYVDAKWFGGGSVLKEQLRPVSFTKDPFVLEMKAASAVDTEQRNSLHSWTLLAGFVLQSVTMSSYCLKYIAVL